MGIEKLQQIQKFTPFLSSVLNEIQCGFPISADPYGEIANRVGGTREKVYEAVIDLRNKGVIRRIGASFAAKQLGYVSVLVASLVEADKIEEAAAIVGSYAEVTHNYERTGPYNLWFTVIARDQGRLNEIITNIRRIEGVKAVHPLPASRTFKIKVDFKFGGEEHAE